jgi:hypothetical protein
VAVAALTLTGCGTLSPGAAAEVNGEKITMAQVDDLMKAQCDALDVAAKGGQSQALPISDVKRRVLGLLIDTQLSRQFAESEGVATSAQVADLIYTQTTQGIDQLPSRARATLSDAFHDWSDAQAGLVAVAARQSGQAPSASNLQSLFDAGMTARKKWQKSADVETDPRFSPDENGLPGAGDGSVSRATSSFAKGATAGQVSPAFVDALPDGQKCG